MCRRVCRIASTRCEIVSVFFCDCIQIHMCCKMCVRCRWLKQLQHTRRYLLHAPHYHPTLTLCDLACHHSIVVLHYQASHVTSCALCLIDWSSLACVHRLRDVVVTRQDLMNSALLVHWFVVVAPEITNTYCNVIFIKSLVFVTKYEISNVAQHVLMETFENVRCYKYLLMMHIHLTTFDHYLLPTQLTCLHRRPHNQ